MANILLLYDPVTNNGTFSGGGWEATLPLANLMDSQPQKVARSTDATAANTLFKVDLGSTQAVRAFALINHNITSAGTVRFRLSANSDLSAPLIDITIDINDPNIAYGSLPWGVFPWDWYESLAQPGGPTVSYYHTSVQYGRYIGVDVVDTSNPDDYVQAGVFLAGAPFVPAINIAYGAGIVLNDPSKQTRAAGGAVFTDVKPQYRTVSASLEYLTQAEALGAIYRMRRVAGVSGPVLMIIDSDDTDGPLAAGTVYGRFARVDQPITYARPGGSDDPTFSVAFEVEERPAA